MYIPRDALPKECHNECILCVKALISEEFPDIELKSGIYSITSTVSFEKPIKVELEYFSTETESLKFYRKLDGQADVIPSDGVFPSNRSFASQETKIMKNGLNLFTIGKEKQESKVLSSFAYAYSYPEDVYHAYLFIKRMPPSKSKIFFAVVNENGSSQQVLLLDLGKDN